MPLRPSLSHVELFSIGPSLNLDSVDDDLGPTGPSPSKAVPFELDLLSGAVPLDDGTFPISFKQLDDDIIGSQQRFAAGLEKLWVREPGVVSQDLDMTPTDGVSNLAQVLSELAENNQRRQASLKASTAAEATPPPSPQLRPPTSDGLSERSLSPATEPNAMSPNRRWGPRKPNLQTRPVLFEHAAAPAATGIFQRTLSGEVQKSVPAIQQMSGEGGLASWSPDWSQLPPPVSLA